MLQSALDYVSWGFAVFPLGQNSKIPTQGSSGWKGATKDTNAIRAMWMSNRKANVGVAMGDPSGVVGIDLDKGATRETLKLFPRTVTVRSKHGWHLYFKHIPGVTYNKQLIKEGFHATLRSTGLYFVGVGSVVDGHEYTWESDQGGELSPEECAYAELPAEFLPKVKKAYGENTRHQMFVETATAMRAKGKQSDEVLAELHRRNQQDCDPPKQNCDKELEDIVKWVFETVNINAEQASRAAQSTNRNNSENDVSKECEHYVQPLGYDDSAYYYTSSSNKQIVKLSASGHTSSGLMHLMPRAWWEKQGYSKGLSKNGTSLGIDWEGAASDLLEECRSVGIFDPKKVRGLGCWREGENLVVHLGDRLLTNGAETGLNLQGSRHIYELRTSLPSPTAQVATMADRQAVIEAANSLAWADHGQALCFAGGMALLRICGALKWRPMLWLTGPSGSGKSTVMDRVVKNIAGSHGVYIVGNTSEAGIRQKLKASAQPVIFDEAETDDKRSSGRMKGVLELVRQASSDSDAQILKGTSDGKGHAFKVNSMFILSSIQVNLTSEQDINRFTVLDMQRNNPVPWPEVARKLDAVTEELGDRLFSYMIKNFATLQANQAVLEKLIAAKTDMRTAQQYSILLAGYATLRSETVMTEAQADALVESLTMINRVHANKVESEQERECLGWLKVAVVDVERTSGRERMTMGQLITKATGDDEHLKALNLYGINVRKGNVYVAVSNPKLEEIYRNTRWAGGMWGRTLARLPNSRGDKPHRILNHPTKTTEIPYDVVVPGGADDAPYDNAPPLP